MMDNSSSQGSSSGREFQTPQGMVTNNSATTSTPSGVDLSLYSLSRALLGTAASAMLDKNNATNPTTATALLRHQQSPLTLLQAVGGWSARTSATNAGAGDYAPPATSTSIACTSSCGTSSQQLAQSIRALEAAASGTNPTVSVATFLSSTSPLVGEQAKAVNPRKEANPAQIPASSGAAQSLDGDHHAAGSETVSHKTAAEKRNEGGNKNGSTVPCRARGMPKDHNATTACFFIPPDIAHGEGLRCSHPGCRAKGIRFRFCSVCSVPVAKRNFSTRHHHGDLLEQSIREENGLVAVRTEADEDLAKRRELLLREKRGGRVVTSSCSSSTNSSSSAAGGSSSSVTSSITEDDQHLVEHGDRTGKRRRKAGAASSTTTSTAIAKKHKRETAVAANALETYSRNFHGEWMKLLAERPGRQDEAGLEKWLGKVVVLSERMSSDPPLRAQVEYLHETEEA